MKRVLIIAKSRHLDTLGGVAFFNNALCKLLINNDFVVDICTEKQLRENNWIYTNKANLIFESDYTSQFSNKFHFYDTCFVIEFDFMLQMQKSLLKAFTHHHYDFILIQSEECILPLLDMQRFYEINKHKIFYYLHRIWFDSKEMTDFRKKFFRFILNCCNVLLPADCIAESINLQKYDVLPLLTIDSIKECEKIPNSILFNGRWANEKKPMDFINYVKKNSELFPIVITNQNGVQKFRDHLPNAKIFAGIHGEAKQQILGECEYLFHPSETETMSYSILEALRNKCRPIVNKEYRWAKYHLYEKELLNIDDNLKKLEVSIDFFKSTENKWIEFINNIPEIKISTTTKLKDKIENSQYAIDYSKLYDNRNMLCDSDLSVLTKLASQYKIENQVDKTLIYKNKLNIEEGNDWFE